jgi:hypothetical protein
LPDPGTYHLEFPGRGGELMVVFLRARVLGKVRVDGQAHLGYPWVKGHTEREGLLLRSGRDS